ncbi:MAG: hypothetical protein HXY38_04730, partial [Chloroflexi bacterium]|nr:hypothetical protein [Chloroflexota bacterium]
METNANNPTGKTIGLIVGIVVLLCCLCLLAAGIGGYAYYNIMPANSFEDPLSPPAPPSEETPPEIERPDADTITKETIEILQTTIVPINDPRELACRLNGKCNVPKVMAESAAPRSLGEKQNFWVHDLDTNENNEVTATLRYITPHVYFWAQDGLDIDEDEMKALVETFENEIYPTNREFFGSEWSPGIDGDEHIYIL